MNRLSKLLLFLVIFNGISSLPNCVAEEPGLKVAYVDLQKALAASKAGKKAQKGYEAEVKKAQGLLDKKKSEYERLKDAFGKQRESLNETALREKEEQILELERDIKRSFKDSQEKLRRKNTVIVADLIKDIRKTVAGIGEKEGLTIILEKSAQAVLYADNKIDITDQVVKKFDQESKN